MRKLVVRSLPLALAALLAAACVTVNVYFPAAQVDKAAEQIVSDVYGQPQPPQPDQKKATDKSSWLGGLLAWLGPAQAHAQDAVNVSNAAIRGLKGQIQANHQQLLPFYNAGQVGIQPDGYLAVRSTEGLGLAQQAQLRRLVEADNQARAQLYQEVAKALNLSPDQVPQIQEIFAKHWRGQAQGGWLIN